MKRIFFSLAILTFAMGCEKAELNFPTEHNELSEKQNFTNSNSDFQRIATTQVLNSRSVITISIHTRGFYESITINNKRIDKNSSGVVSPSSKAISNSKWNKLNFKFSKLILTSIPNHFPPSCNRCDGSDMSEALEIKHNGKVYLSKEYDRNNPPLALKDFLIYAKSI